MCFGWYELRGGVFRKAHGVKPRTGARYLFGCARDEPAQLPLQLRKREGVPFEEYVHFTGRTFVDMLSYREHPIDKMHVLAEYKIPIVMVAGDSDGVVPYDENGALLEKYYKQCGLPNNACLDDIIVVTVRF